MTGDVIWKDLRRFSGWTCAGCVVGVAFVSMQWQRRLLEYDTFVPDIARRQFYELRAISLRYYAAYHIFIPTHLLCVIEAMNMLLCRVSDHASHSYYNTLRDADDSNRSSTSSRKRFDWRDCIGQYALYRPPPLTTITLLCTNILSRAGTTGCAPCMSSPCCSAC